MSAELPNEPRHSFTMKFVVNGVVQQFNRLGDCCGLWRCPVAGDEEMVEALSVFVLTDWM